MSDKPHGSHDNPLTQLWIAMSGASSGHHEETPGVEPKSVAVGHEPDRFGIGGIVAVPIAVIVTLVITYVIVTMLVRYVNHSSSDPLASKDPSINERLGRINSTGGTAAPGVRGAPLGEPRLDGLPKIDTRVAGKDVAPYLMSFRKTPTGNWPDIYPEDLRPADYIDYETRKKPLADPPEAFDSNKAYARLPIDEAIHLLTSNEEYKKRYVPAAAAPNPALAPTERPKQSNGGQTTKAPPAAEPKLAPKAGH